MMLNICFRYRALIYLYCAVHEQNVREICDKIVYAPFYVDIDVLRDKDVLRDFKDDLKNNYSSFVFQFVLFDVDLGYV